jgi:ribokinase
MGRIAVIGSSMMDLITYVERMPEAGETIPAPRFAMGFGGKGANQAVAAAKLGSQVAMVGRIGDDAFGRATLENFSAHGIETRHVQPTAGVSNGVAPIFVEPSGENRILIVAGANAHLSPADIDQAREVIAAADLVLLQLEIPLETVYHAIALARELDRPVLLNPAPAHPALDLARLAGVTFFVPNESELRTLTGRPAETLSEAEAAARPLLAAGLPHVIVTLGARGALWLSAEGAVHIPPLAVTPVDTTGAGDAFIGAFAHFYTEGEEISRALHLAGAYAADAITRPGTQASFADAAHFARFRAAHSLS